MGHFRGLTQVEEVHESPEVMKHNYFQYRGQNKDQKTGETMDAGIKLKEAVMVTTPRE